MIPFTDLRLRTYLLVYLFCIFLLMAGFLLGCFYANKYILANLIVTASQEIFQQETHSQLKVVWIQQTHLASNIRSAFRQMSTVNLLQHQIPSLNRFEITPPYRCLSDPRDRDSYVFESSHCYGIFNKSSQDTKDLQLIINVTSVLATYKVSFDIYPNHPAYYSHKSNSLFYSISQGFPFPANFNPHQRPWYLQHQNASVKSRVFGLPYQVLTGAIKVPLLTSLESLTSAFEGVLARDINFDSEVQNYENQNFRIYIVNLEGRVIFSHQYLQTGTEFFHISNTSQTGFTTKDWDNLRKIVLNDSSVKRNCSDMFLETEQVLCVWNSLEDKKLLVTVQPIMDSPFYVVLYQINGQLLQEQDSLLTLIQSQLDQIINQYVVAIIVVMLGLMFGTYLIAGLVMQQTNFLIVYGKANIGPVPLKALQDQIRKQSEKLIVESDTINALFAAIDRLRHVLVGSSSSRGTCRLMQDLKYPKSCITLRNTKLLRFCYSSVQYLRNQSNQPKKYHLGVGKASERNNLRNNQPTPRFHQRFRFLFENIPSSFNLN